MDKEKTGVYNGSTVAVANLLNDTVFKFVFGEERRKPILICLLTALLSLKGREKISEIEILNPHLERESLDDKLAILDSGRATAQANNTMWKCRWTRPAGMSSGLHTMRQNCSRAS